MATIQPGLEFVFRISCDLDPPLVVGETAAGLRRIVPIRGGRVEGAQLRAEVLMGADWQVVRRDGVVELVAQYALRTEDGVLIQVRNRGLRHGPAEVLARMGAGAAVDPAEYYCRTSPVFEAPEGKYAWLNRSVFVATAERLRDAIHLDVFRVL